MAAASFAPESNGPKLAISAACNNSPILNYKCNSLFFGFFYQSLGCLRLKNNTVILDETGIFERNVRILLTERISLKPKEGQTLFLATRQRVREQGGSL